MEINYADIGRRIRERRLQLGITQEKLAELIGIGIPHMSGIENGKTTFSFKKSVRIVNVLGMSMDELLCGSLQQGKSVMQSEFAHLLEDCSPAEAAFMVSMLKSMKKGLRAVVEAQKEGMV